MNNKNQTNQIDATLIYYKDGELHSFRTNDPLEVAQFIELSKRCYSEKNGIVCKIKVHEQKGKMRKLPFIKRAVNDLINKFKGVN